MVATGRKSPGRRPGRPPGQLADGEALRAIREARSLTHAQLAERAGVNSRTVARAERGQAVSATSLEAIAGALRVPSHSLVRGEADQARLEQLGLGAPPPPQPFRERPQETDTIIERLTGEVPRLCCIAGPSGIGKTSLARVIAHRLTATFPHGVIWLKASHQGQPVEVIDTQLRIADALYFRTRLPAPEHTHETAFDRSFARELWSSSRRVLIVDDLLSPSFIGHFLPATGHVPVLVTTHLQQVAERFGDGTIELGGLTVADTRAILLHHLGPSRVPESRPPGGLPLEGSDGDGSDATSGIARLHEILGGVPRSIYIAGVILQRRRLLAIDEYVEHLRRDPFFGEEPAALRTVQNSLHMSFAQLEHHVSPPAWTLLGDLSLFDEAHFSIDWAAAAGGLNTAVEVKQLLSELLDLYLVAQHDGGFRLDSHVPMFARGILGGRRDQALERIAAQAGAVSQEAAGRGDFSAIVRHRTLWSQILSTMVSEVCDITELRQWSGLAPYPGTICPAGDLAADRSACQDKRQSDAPRDLAARLVDIARDLAQYFERDSAPETEIWLRGAAACALHLERHSDAARLLLALGRFWLRAQVDLEKPIRWFDAATELFLQVGDHALAAAAASESGRALFGSERPIEGLQRFDAALEHARTAFDRGTELACRINSAAVSFTRAPGLDGWRRAAELLAAAVDACGDESTDDRLFRIVCSCNLASVSLVLAGSGESTGLEPSACVAQIERAADDLHDLAIDAPLLESRLLFLRMQYADSADQTAALQQRAAELWRTELRESRHAVSDLLWQLGEAAFYLRLHRLYLAAPDQGMSPVISQGLALSDLSRGLPFENNNLVPVGFLFPVAPLEALFDSDLVREAKELAHEVYGAANRILQELEALETSAPGGETPGQD